MEIGLTVIICFTLIAGLKAEHECGNVPDTSKYTCPVGENNPVVSNECSGKDLTTFQVSSCVSVTVNKIENGHPNKVTSLRVENVTNELHLEVYFEDNITSIELLNIGRIPKIKDVYFGNVQRIDNFRIENTRIGYLDLPFNMFTKTMKLILKNVVIEELSTLEIENAKELDVTIINCQIKINGGHAYLKATNKERASIKLINTTFEFNTPEVMNLTIIGKSVEISHCTFVRTFVNVIGEKSVIRNTYGGEKSSLRIESYKTEVHDNQISTETIERAPEIISSPPVDEVKNTTGAGTRISHSLSLCLIGVSSIFIIRM
ncbi:uncharacterized protein LOC124409123 [Diprion similis]|uniref:uncharacterized protein LOC124409123 n=1 Tax=Diprion similis TaxID=362088 RepID=UPI001EF86385|nr:uncharacterized protein LOC124409123 [Diprion similis]